MPTFTETYLQSDDALGACYAWPLKGLDIQQVAKARAKHKVNRQVLCNYLEAYHKRLGLHPKSLENIALLRQEGTFSVTTGQQPGLFGGPLYSLFKSLSAVRQAEAYSQQLGAPVVPVFWIASEDHDWDEVNHTYLSYTQSVQHPGAVHGPVGRFKLTAESEALLPDNELIKQAYCKGASWADAFAKTLGGLAGHLGLIILDADAPELKALFAGTMEQELQEQASQPVVETYTSKLEAAGHKGQIHARPINLFHMTDDSRQRILTDEEAQQADAEGIAASELKQAEPYALSPNVVLRPVYQEVLLPNLAYVGGWAEVRYWGQLRGVFKHYGVPMPVVLPRFSGTLMSRAQAEQLSAMGLEPGALRQPWHTLKHWCVEQHWQGENLDEVQKKITAGMAQLATLVEPMDAGQAYNVRGMLSKLHKHFEHVHRRLSNRLAEQNPEWLAPLLALKQAVQPDGWVQERSLNWLAFAALAGSPQALADAIYEHVEAGTHGHTVVML